MQRLTAVPIGSATTGTRSPVPGDGAPTGSPPGVTGSAAMSTMGVPGRMLAVAKRAAELSPAEVERRIATLLPRSLVPSSGWLPSRPAETAPPDLEAGAAERLRDWIAGTCLPARELDGLMEMETGRRMNADAAVRVGAAVARLRAVTVSRRSDAVEQELLADELLRLCLNYPVDVAVAALEEAKTTSRFFPAYADLQVLLERLVRPRRLWLRAVESWPAQMADGRHREVLRRRRDRAARIVVRLETRRSKGCWLPRDQVEWELQRAALDSLDARLSALRRVSADAHLGIETETNQETGHDG